MHTLDDSDCLITDAYQISSTPWHDMQTEINIRLTCEIDIRKETSRNGTTGFDKIREDHRKEIQTIQPALDTWTA
ncbi:hypothetical protein HGM15179_018449 [Zosterops borbonicus]|uniref:Uncharacterized protein n=1 Tax=Zosterops borbonicus TaxID=364589 RepID=A0A8K1LC48_9PASS|nr:hypothetical protein HGM15179_018449 [Zosterops borbonicus]